MLIGILSDTHGHHAAMLAGVAALQQRGAEYLLHCGDVGPARMLDGLMVISSAFVFGNTDDDIDDLRRYASEIGVSCLERFGSISLDGKQIALMHGDDSQMKRGVLESQEFDYFFQGHTHIRHDSRQGRTRIINPGALYRAVVKTVALLDTANDALQFIEVTVPPTPDGD